MAFKFVPEPHVVHHPMHGHYSAVSKNSRTPNHPTGTAPAHPHYLHCTLHDRESPIPDLLSTPPVPACTVYPAPKTHTSVRRAGVYNTPALRRGRKVKTVYWLHSIQSSSPDRKEKKDNTLVVHNPTHSPYRQRKNALHTPHLHLRSHLLPPILWAVIECAWCAYPGLGGKELGALKNSASRLNTRGIIPTTNNVHPGRVDDLIWADTDYPSYGYQDSAPQQVHYQESGLEARRLDRQDQRGFESFEKAFDTREESLDRDVVPFVKNKDESIVSEGSLSRRGSSNKSAGWVTTTSPRRRLYGSGAVMGGTSGLARRRSS
ncbi:hypothetical protein NMY22_g7938 [Coprinellus aureogranulatus]|nr:hypothetical protein NMY22_g7938 [Coprinellus aureogranulatus]